MSNKQNTGTTDFEAQDPELMFPDRATATDDDDIDEHDRIEHVLSLPASPADDIDIIEIQSDLDASGVEIDALEEEIRAGIIYLQDLANNTVYRQGLAQRHRRARTTGRVSSLNHR